MVNIDRHTHPTNRSGRIPVTCAVCHQQFEHPAGRPGFAVRGAERWRSAAAANRPRWMSRQNDVSTDPQFPTVQYSEIKKVASHTKAAGRAIAKQNKENLKAAATKARGIVKMPDGLINGNVLRRKRGTQTDEDCIDQICSLISNGVTVVDALQHVKLDPKDWYKWQRNNYCYAMNQYEDALHCHLEVMVDRTLKVFVDLEAKREAAKLKLIADSYEWKDARRAFSKKLEAWRALDPDTRGAEPKYDGLHEPAYHGPGEWELASAKAKANMWKFHMQSGLKRFKKRERG